MAAKRSKAAQAALNAVTGKRARIVVDHIAKHGSITTDDLKEKYGYDHPPRAIKDVSDQGIPLVKAIVRKADGKRMAEYRFGDLDNITAGRVGGRANFPKAFKEALVAAYGCRCALCNAPFEARYLQIDHRIPYLVAGDRIAAELNVKDYMLVCGSCNRSKSWSCEHCPNGLEKKDQNVCAACYWTRPTVYTHVATADIRRLDVTWMGNEVTEFDAARTQAIANRQALPEFVKDAVRRELRAKNDQATRRNDPKPRQ